MSAKYKNPNNFNQKAANEAGAKALVIAKGMGKKTIFLPKGVHKEKVKTFFYKKRIHRFKIDEYAEEIRNFDTSKCHVSIFGAAGTVMVKTL